MLHFPAVPGIPVSPMVSANMQTFDWPSTRCLGIIETLGHARPERRTGSGFSNPHAEALNGTGDHFHEGMRSVGLPARLEFCILFLAPCGCPMLPKARMYQ
jgi:hypothetical protein